MRFLIWAVFFLSTYWSSLTAQEALSEIIIQGNQRVDERTVLNYLNLSKGDLLTPEILDQALKALHKTGFFTDIQLTPSHTNLLIKVEEAPLLNRVAYEGAEEISPATLEKEIGLKPRTLFSRAKIQAAVVKILAIYRQLGRFSARVEPKIIERDQNRVDLIFEITEGDPSYVQAINFLGNRTFSASTLERALQTKEKRWYRFFTSDDTYDPDRMAYDQDKLIDFYRNHGYADMEVTSTTAELSPDHRGFYLTYTLSEGPRYTFGLIEFDIRVPNITADLLGPALEIAPGGEFSSKGIDLSLEEMVDVFSRLGLSFVVPIPELKKNPEAQTVDVTFRIEQGPPQFIEKIEVIGNTRTLDSVIRRQLTIAEGDALNPIRIKESKENLEDLDYFSDVKLEATPGSDPSKVTLRIKVTEKNTGSLMFAIGYGGEIGALGEISARERNILGHGYEAGIRAQIAMRESLYELQFVNPFLFNRPLEWGVSVFRTTSNLQKESQYSVKDFGGSTWISYKLSPRWTQRIGYTLDKRTIEKVPEDASPYVKMDKGSKIRSTISHTLTYNRLNSNLDPTSGFIASLTTEYAGLGGEVKYFRNILGVTHFIPVAEDWVLVNRGRIGLLSDMGQRIRIADRFFLGGESLRGFDYAGIGPFDALYRKDSLGGRKMFSASTELRFPIDILRDVGVKGAIFLDAGSVWDSPDQASTIRKDMNVRLSVGFGLLWKSPFGPIRFDFAWPLRKTALDKKRIFLFGCRLFD